MREQRVRFSAVDGQPPFNSGLGPEDATGPLVALEGNRAELGGGETDGGGGDWLGGGILDLGGGDGVVAPKEECEDFSEHADVDSSGDDDDGEVVPKPSLFPA